MVNFLIRRLLYGFVVIFGVVIVVFFIFNALPGDPVSLMSGQRTDVAQRDATIKELGLDKPLSFQLGMYLNDLSPISVHPNTPESAMKYNYTRLIPLGGSVLVVKFPYMRRSFQTNKLVTEIISENIVGTMWLAIAAMIFATIVGIAFGIISAIYKNTWIDHSLNILAVFGISAPSFVLAVMVSMIFGYYWADFTGLNMTGYLWVTDAIEGQKLVLKNLILPALTLGIRPLSIIVQLTRSSMLEVLSQDYIRTARSKGLSKAKVIMKHALKNALNPVITAVSGWFASLLAGAFFVEYIFNWKGIGYTTVKAVESLDFPVVMGSTLFVAIIFVVVNIVVDMLYAVVDPRIRLK
jgi:ABC-type dipeptide/oligopeptide/nickel transport system permease component